MYYEVYYILLLKYIFLDIIGNNIAILNGKQTNTT